MIIPSDRFLSDVGQRCRRRPNFGPGLGPSPPHAQKQCCWYLWATLHISGGLWVLLGRRRRKLRTSAVSPPRPCPSAPSRTGGAAIRGIAGAPAAVLGQRRGGCSGICYALGASWGSALHGTRRRSTGGGGRVRSKGRPEVCIKMGALGSDRRGSRQCSCATQLCHTWSYIGATLAMHLYYIATLVRHWCWIGTTHAQHRYCTHIVLVLSWYCTDTTLGKIGTAFARQWYCAGITLLPLQ